MESKHYNTYTQLVIICKKSVSKLRIHTTNSNKVNFVIEFVTNLFLSIHITQSHYNNNLDKISKNNIVAPATAVGLSLDQNNITVNQSATSRAKDNIYAELMLQWHTNEMMLQHGVS